MSKLMTRIANMFGIGRVTGQNDAGVTQKIQYQTPLEVANAHRLLDFGFSSGLPEGSDVVIAFVGGDRSSPVVIASGHQGFRYTGLNAGEVVVYNQWGVSILLTEAGITVEAAGQNITVNNARDITATASGMAKFITPKLLCTGDIIDNCETNSITLKQLRDAHNLHDHIVKGVQSGDSNIKSEKTGEPVNG